MRELIVNADDFGRSPAINAGVVEAHRHGILTSASLMVCWPAAGEAVAMAHRRGDLGLGLHLDLGEWRREAGEWIAVYERVPGDDRAAIGVELERQLGLFRELVGRNPTHLDSHQHVHLREPVRSAASELAGRLGVPLRRARGGVRYCGDFYGQGNDGEALPEGISASRLIELVEAVEPGITEIACHPGIGVDAESPYAAEREREVAALCDPRVSAAIERGGVILRSFAGVGVDRSKP